LTNVHTIFEFFFFLRHAFGITKTLNNNIFHLDNERIVYPVGRHFGICKTSTESMSFLLETEKNKSVTQTAITLSHDKRYLASCELVDDDTNTASADAIAGQFPHNSLQISIFSFVTNKKIRILQCPADVNDASFSCVAFSTDNKHLAACCSMRNFVFIFYFHFSHS
jgi:hypothetical protein